MDFEKDGSYAMEGTPPWRKYAVMGGWVDGGDVASTTVEYYGPHSSTWEFAAAMATARQSFAAATLDRFIYVTAGTWSDDTGKGEKLGDIKTNSITFFFQFGFNYKLMFSHEHKSKKMQANTRKG